eukprot:758104-Hanusia_phi.AAC.3
MLGMPRGGVEVERWRRGRQNNEKQQLLSSETIREGSERSIEKTMETKISRMIMTDAAGREEGGGGV